MDSTFDTLETEVIAFVQQQNADLEALRSDLNNRLDARRKALGSAATKLLQRVEELRKQAAAAQVTSATATTDVAVNTVEHGMFSAGIGNRLPTVFSSRPTRAVFHSLL